MSGYMIQSRTGVGEVDFFFPDFLSILEGGHGGSSTAHFPLMSPLVIVAMDPHIEESCLSELLPIGNPRMDFMRVLLFLLPEQIDGETGDAHTQRSPLNGGDGWYSTGIPIRKSGTTIPKNPMTPPNSGQIIHP